MCTSGRKRGPWSILSIGFLEERNGVGTDDAVRTDVDTLKKKEFFLVKEDIWGGVIARLRRPNPKIQIINDF